MLTEREKMVSGEYYSTSDPELRLERDRAHRLMRLINHADDMRSEEYREWIRELLPNCPEQPLVRMPFYVDYGSNIYCGKGCFFNFGCTLLDVAPIRIGRNCLFGPNVQILTASHPMEADIRRTGAQYGKPITIGDDCWFGGGVIVLPGVTIGDRVVAGAGAVITKDIPSDAVVAGNPAKIIKTREP